MSASDDTNTEGEGQTENEEGPSDTNEISEIVTPGKDENDEPMQSTSAATSPTNPVVDLPSCAATPANCSNVEVDLSSSSSASLCRICQVSGSESDGDLVPCNCQCKGYLSKAHQGCLLEWVRHKGSNVCEICDSTFADVPRQPAQRSLLGVDARAADPPASPDLILFEQLAALQWQLNRFPPLSRRKRSAVASVILFLLLITGVSAILTVSADRDYKAVTKDPFATRGELDKAHVVFSICVSFVFFCGTLTVGMILLWVVVECIYSIQRRRLIENATRNYIAARQRQAARNAQAI